MATLIAKAPPFPVIQASRLTCVGMQSTVADFTSIQVVTVDNEGIACTCGASACIHIQAVREQQAHQAQANACRDAYCALFDLGYVE